MEIAALHLFIAVAARRQSAEKLYLKNHVRVLLILLLRCDNTTDGSQGPEACGESERHAGLCCSRVSSVKVHINHHIGTCGPSPLL